MITLLKVFFDILRQRAGPEDLPTAPQLPWIALAVLVGLQAGLGAWLLPQDPSILPQALASGLASLAWLALLLRLYGKPERFAQTATAVLGIACLFAPISIPVMTQVRPDAAGMITFSPLVLLAFALSLYLIYINGRILRAAIERPLAQCILLFLLGEFLVFALLVMLGIGRSAA